MLPEVRVSALGTDAVVDGCLASGTELAWKPLTAMLPVTPGPDDAAGPLPPADVLARSSTGRPAGDLGELSRTPRAALSVRLSRQFGGKGRTPSGLLSCEQA